MREFLVYVDNVLVHRYKHTEQLTFDQWPTAVQVEVVEPPAPSDPAPAPQPVRITKLAFRNRFTQAEKVAIEIAALDVPAATMQQRAQAAALRAHQADVAVATFIDLNRPDTRAGVQALEAAGLLAAGRAAVILDTPPTAEEVWNA